MKPCDVCGECQGIKDYPTISSYSSEGKEIIRLTPGKGGKGKGVFKMKNATELRQYHKMLGEKSTLGPACPGCGLMENEGNRPSYRGFCSDHDDPENGHSVFCPDCGEEYYGYFIWIDPDGTKAINSFANAEDLEVKYEPEFIYPDDPNYPQTTYNPKGGKGNEKTKNRK